MRLRKKLLPLLLAPALFFGTPSKAKAGERFDFTLKIDPANFSREVKFEIEKVSKDTYKICATAKFLGKTENVGCIYRKVQNTNSQTTTHQHTNKTLYKQKQEKHYNWIKPNKYNNWQCAYELIYPHNDKRNKPKGFYLYVDTDGDNKPDYRYRYTLQDIDGFFGGATYDFELDTNQTPVGGGWKDNLYSAMNVCGIDAIKRLFYQRDDLVERPSKYEITEMDLDIYYPQITFERR